MSTDWQEMEAGRELDRLICEKLGWRAVEFEGLWLLTPFNRDDEHVRRMAMEHPDFWQRAAKLSEDAAWRFDGSYPHYSISLDAAWTLLPNDLDYRIENTLTGCACAIDVHDTYGPIGEGYATAYAEADTPALAICRAWLAWKESEGK